ncbi:MAG: arginine--tRNA ligase [Bacteroidales bacterium]
MNPEVFISDQVKLAVGALYSVPTDNLSITVQQTKKEFIGDFTVVMFPLLRISKKSPKQTSEEVGSFLKEHISQIESYNVIKGFLNIKFSNEFWLNFFVEISKTEDYGQGKPTGKTIMVEYSSPNTNKPLHLGHIRNNLLGWSVATLLKANGHNVIKVNLVNDRGIHICKSMLAWLKTGNGETPETSGKKGDHLVGDYYVKFNDLFKEEVSVLKSKGMSEEDAEKNSTLLKEARVMLFKWEHGDEEVRNLWKKMNSWVYDGFIKTYNRLGIDFDKTYYESDTYLLGKKIVNQGLEKGVFEKHEDNSVWCDLTADGLDKKLLLRPDGTSVYITQDIGTAVERFEEFGFKEHIYVVGNEQNYHFQVLKLILKKLGYDWADRICHLSYGMVELPEGKMKSREGTVVDADELLENMYQTARDTSLELGKLQDMDPKEQNKLFETIGLGALKYFIIKVDPKKTMMFNPMDSIDFNGNTGPFIQYTYARIRSILRKADKYSYKNIAADKMHEKEIELIKTLKNFPSIISEAGAAHSPALVANYIYEIAKEFNQYYHDVSILKEPDENIKGFRLVLIEVISKVLFKAMHILGINLPERM